jgi:hypothetical protein
MEAYLIAPAAPASFSQKSSMQGIPVSSLVFGAPDHLRNIRIVRAVLS